MATLEIIYAAYECAGTGQRVDWPHEPKDPAAIPVKLWLGA